MTHPTGETRVKDWLILRCSGMHTLRLAHSLRDAGMEAWTPAEEIRKIVHGKIAWVEVPMIPTFVFASSAHLGDLLRLTHTPAMTFRVWDADRQCMVEKGHPFFRLFRVGEDIRTVPARELEPLQRIEGRRKRKPRGIPRAYHPGDRVRLTEGAYEGLRGVVIAIHGKQVEVDFPGSSLAFKVFPHVLIPDIDGSGAIHVSGRLPEQHFRAAA
jgi:transcription antitermination factor NusG